MVQAVKSTAGYPNVEKLIDSEDFGALNKAFSKAYGELEKVAKAKGGLKTEREAKKAMQALDKVSELLKELLQIKYRLQEELSKKTKKS